MSLQVGDQVSFLNEALNGVVNKIIDSKTVEVTTQDGFNIPTLVQELVVTKAKNSVTVGGDKHPAQVGVQQETKISKRTSLEKKDYLCFAQTGGKGTELYILNNTECAKFYVLRVLKQGHWVVAFSGKVSKQSYVFVANYNEQELNDFAKARLETINMDMSLKELDLPTKADIKIKAVKFHKESSFVEVPIIEKNAMLVDASGETVQEVETHEALKKSVENIVVRTLPKPKIIGKIDLSNDKRSRSRGEIDLHIEKLGINGKGKSNGEIVQQQMERCKDFVDKAILAGKREIVIIHGVGTGLLKQEVHKLLKSYYAIKFEKATSRNYGEGATLVHLK